MKNPHFGTIFSPNGMRQAEKEGKKFQSRLPFILGPWQKIPKEIAKKFKNLFPALFLAKTGRDRLKKEKKISPNSVHTRPREENSEKNRKKIQKIKKLLSGVISSQNGMSQDEKERKKNLVPNSVHTQLGQENSEKNSKKIQQIKKPHSGIIFIQNGIRSAEKERKKFQSQIPFILGLGKKIPKKQKKDSKN